ncbi:MAG: hypothetical protein WC371_00235 [Parachlamydiales bacterium]|jgi:hypothetical protein
MILDEIAPLYFIFTPHARIYRDLKYYLHKAEEECDGTKTEQRKIKQAEAVVTKVNLLLTQTIQTSRKLMELYGEIFQKGSGFEAVKIDVNAPIFKNLRLVLKDLLESETKRQHFFACSKVTGEVIKLVQMAYQVPKSAF